MKIMLDKFVAFIKDNKKMTAILLLFLVIGGIISGLCIDYWARTGRTPFAKPGKVCVVIDPGHGGSDVGAVNGNRYEKDDNLRLALKVKECLENKGIDVALTRTVDIFISLEDRCKFANSRSAELFVSLHRNSAATDVGGTEIWIESENPYRARSLSKTILGGLDEAGISDDRGVKTGYITDRNKDYYVNSHTNMTSCLVELGFITSETDNKLFDKNLDAYAQAIADAIEAHI